MSDNKPTKNMDNVLYVTMELNGQSKHASISLDVVEKYYVGMKGTLWGLVTDAIMSSIEIQTRLVLGIFVGLDPSVTLQWLTDQENSSNQPRSI